MPSLVRPAFRSVASARRAPAFHPRGVFYDARIEVRGPGALPLGAHDCLVRLSKGMGTPHGAPDLLGLALRVLVEPPVDVLCTTALAGTWWGRWLLWPRRRWAGHTLTSLMPWRSPTGELVQVLVEVADPRLDSPEPDVLLAHLPVALSLRVAGRAGDVQTATVVVTSRSRRDRTAFEPVLHAPAGWPLVPGWLARLRTTAYAGSRAGSPGHRAG